MCSTHGWSSCIRFVPDFTHFTITVHACLYVGNAWIGTLFTTWVLAAFNIKMEEAAWQIFVFSLWSRSGQGNFRNVGCSSMSCGILFLVKGIMVHWGVDMAFARWLEPKWTWNTILQQTGFPPLSFVIDKRNLTSIYTISLCLFEQRSAYRLPISLSKCALAELLCCLLV